MPPKNNSRFTHSQAVHDFRGYMQRCTSLRSERLGEDCGRQIVDLTFFLEHRTDYLSAPASTKYHLACGGGLVMHSVGVTETALKLRDTLMPEIPTDSVILCALLHDAGKIYARVGEDDHMVPRYKPNILKSTGKQSEDKPFTYNQDANEIALTIKDLLVPMKFVDLSDAEMQALLFADGPYVNVNDKLLHNEHPLSLVIHWADYWEGHIMEGDIKADWLSGVFRGASANPPVQHAE